MQNKIVSLVLALALLLGVFVIVPSAEEASSFTPTATMVESPNGANAAEYKVELEGNLVYSTAGLINWDDTAIGYYVVTPAEGEKYGMLVAEAGKTTGNHFLNMGMNNKPLLNFSTGYYVIEADVASESELINAFTLNPVIGWSGSAGSSDRIDNDNNIPLSNFDLGGGDWHHYVIVGDLAANVAYHFVDGKLAATAKTAYKTATYVEGRPYFLDSVRVNIGGSVEVTPGSTICLDNVAVRVFDSDDSLKAAVAAQDLTKWDKAITATKAEKLPALASVNGVEYSSASLASTALSGYTSVEAEILREHAGIITVNGDATVETNGITSALVAADGVKVTTNGTVNTYDAPFKASSQVIDYTVSNNSPEVFDATKGAYPAQYLSVSHDTFADNTVWPYLVQDTVSGNKYVDFRPAPNFDNGTVHNHLNWITPNTNYQAGTYFITEFDTFIESEVMQDLYIGITSRNSAGTNKGGAGSYVKNWNLPVGQWSHVAIIGQVDSNTIYVYVNGVRVDSVANGLANEALTSGHYFQGIRVNVNTRTNLNANQNFAMDNVSYRMNVSDAWLDANYAGPNLFGWSGNNYQLPEVSPIAIVDGAIVDAAPQLNSALLFGAKNVELLRDACGTVTVNCNAVVETNGFKAPAAGEGVTVTNEGTVYTYVAPFSASQLYTVSNDKAQVMAAVKATNLDNRWNYIYLSYFNGPDDAKDANGQPAPKQGASLGITVDKLTGNTYVDLGPGQAGSNSYISVTPSASNTGEAISKTEANQFYVLDMDVALHGEASTSFGWYAVCRYNGSGRFGANVNGGGGLRAALNAAELGEFQHVTTVLDFNNNIAYTFVNGKLVSSVSDGVYGGNGAENFAANDGKFMFEQFRLFSSNVDNFAFDNVSVRKISSIAPLEAAIVAGDLAGWSENIEGSYAKVAPLAKVNGEYVYSASAVNAAIAAGKSVELIREGAYSYNVGVETTIVTHGLKVNFNLAPGYKTQDNGETVSVVRDTTLYNVTVNLNGKPVVSAKSMAGISIADLLAENGIYAAYVAMDGKVYTNLVWETAPAGVVTGDVALNLTATEYDGLYIAVKDGAIIESEQTPEALLAQCYADYDVTLVLAKDVTTAKLSSGLKRNAVIDLNGHTLEFTGNDGSSHDWTLSGSAAGDLTIKNGTLIQVSKTNTQWLFFANYDYRGTIILDNVHLIQNNGLVNLRGGNLTVKNSVIDSFYTLDATFLQVVENYNGNYTKAPCKVLFENTVINHRSTRDYNRGVFLYIKANKDDTSAHTATFVNCVINDRNTVTYSPNQGFVWNENADSKIDFYGCELNTGIIGREGCKNVTVNAGCSVPTVDNLVNCTIADGLVAVKSGNGNTPVLYTDKYATVTWPDGTVELWADGTTPVSAANPLAKVEVVEAGKEYTFANVEKAPCQIKANLSLTDSLVLNVYIPVSAENVQTVTIGGVVYDLAAAETTTIKLVPYYVLSYELDVTKAGAGVTVVVDGFAFNLSVISYAELVYAQHASDAKATALMSAILNYVKAAYYHAAVSAAPVTAAIDELLKAHPVAETTVSGTAGDMSAVNEYLASAQLNVNGDFKFRFNVVEGADISGLVIKVGDKEIAYEVGVGYVEITLCAADMLKDITVSVGEKSGTYNLYTYITYVESVAANYVDGGKAADPAAAKAQYSLKLLKAIYAYAEAAAAYKA